MSLSMLRVKHEAVKTNFYSFRLDPTESLIQLAAVESSKTHFEVLGLEASSARKLPCPRLEDSTIF